MGGGENAGARGVRRRAIKLFAGAVIAWQLGGSTAEAALFATSMPQSLMSSSLSSAGTATRNYYVDPSRLLTQGMTVPGTSGPGTTLQTQVVGMPAVAGGPLRPFGNSVNLEPATINVQGLGGFNLVIVPDPGLAANLPALAAFQRAAQQWANRISDPVLVTVNAGLAPLGPGIIGSTSSVLVGSGYDVIRNRLVADSAGNPNKTIIASMPTV